MAEAEPKQDFKLEKENELRFEVEAPHKARLELVEGHAEIFGVEIVKDKQYCFTSGEDSSSTTISLENLPISNFKRGEYSFL